MTQPPDPPGGENLPVKRTYRPANSPRDKFGPVVPAPVQPSAPAPAPVTPATPAEQPVSPAGPPPPTPGAHEEAADPGRLPVPAGERLPAKRPKRFVPRNTTRNTVIAMLITMVLVCGGGLTAAGWYFYGDEITAKPRSPIETVEGFMQAAFSTRDTEALEKYTCGSAGSARDAVKRLLDSEKQFGDRLMMSWEGLEEKVKSGGRATVVARVTQTAVVNGNMHEGKEATWTFTLADEGDWKVCAIDMGG